jgi:hypothetical protein
MKKPAFRFLSVGGGEFRGDIVDFVLNSLLQCLLLYRDQPEGDRAVISILQAGFNEKGGEVRPFLPEKGEVAGVPRGVLAFRLIRGSGEGRDAKSRAMVSEFCLPLFFAPKTCAGLGKELERKPGSHESVGAGSPAGCSSKTECGKRNRSVTPVQEIQTNFVLQGVGICFQSLTKRTLPEVDVFDGKVMG